MGTLGYFAQMGKPMHQGTAQLGPGSTSFVVNNPITDEWTDFYSIAISTNETTVRALTITDGSTTLTYYVGGAAGGTNPPVFDQGTIPVRFKKGHSFTFSVPAVSVSTTISLNFRWLSSKT